MPYETDFEENSFLIQQLNEEEEDSLINNELIQRSNEEKRILIGRDEEYQRGESSVHGEIWGAILAYEESLRRQSGDDYAPMDEEDYDNYDNVF